MEKQKIKRALLVIDMLNDFIDPKGTFFCGKRARMIIPFGAKQIEAFHRSGDLLIFVRDSHKRQDPEFTIFSLRCLQGTKGAEIIPELQVGPKDIMIFKNRYSAFYNTRLAAILKKKQIKEVYVVGVWTSICVMDTISDLRNRDYPVSFLRRGGADFDAAAHRFALKRMAKIYGAKII